MRPSEQILQVWFGDLEPDGTVAAEIAQRWWSKDPEFDRSLRDRFGAWHARALAGELDAWTDEPRSCLALVLLLDQFSRQIHRGSPLAFAGDSRALEIAERALARGYDRQVRPIERSFFYLPFEHAESRTAQKRSVELFAQLLQDAPAAQKAMYQEFYDFAVRHREIIERFGHFPHRSELLERPVSAEERDFLTQPGSSF